ncbi:unnamed protein product [Triticum turgidum subsp. durum]|uniref:non-specific serine/threonine protein kinase n=1 Tax=Triticum turgidum subsp. durum TaxID=4567 RepID=A0A9R1QX55_TRITD|nr:unnamed protein product [Triticum turgidum subsp. durum]
MGASSSRRRSPPSIRSVDPCRHAHGSSSSGASSSCPRSADLSSTMKMDGNTRGGGHCEALKSYNLGKTLGASTFGKVIIADHKLTGLKVAVKILNRRKMKTMEMEEKANREIKILRSFIDFIHPHIIRIYEVIETPKDIFVVMEYCQNGDLLDYIVEKRRLQEDVARRIFQQIMSAVEYCHTNMVVHRDLKPENLLVDSKYNVKLADFGLSNVMHDGHFLKTSCGSINYAAPEVISGELYAGPEVDVWSCGVILYALLCGAVPFDDDNISKLFNKIKGGFYILPNHLSDLAMDLIPRMLIVDPMKRITTCEIRDHPWFQNRLPRYLAVPPPKTAQQAKMEIDEDTLQDVANLGYDKDHVCESLCNRLKNEETVAYYLILDNRFRATSGYLGAEYQQEMSRAQPRAILIEVLKALKELNVYWKKNVDYNMKCSWCPGFPQVNDMLLDANHSFVDDSTIMDNGDVNRRLPAVIKFEIQLYKTRDGKYLLDMQRVTGPQLLFLEFCVAFLTNLRVL